MRRWMVHTGGGLALLVPFVLGCNLIPGIRNNVNPPPPANMAEKPTTASLVEYLNQEAGRVQNVRATVDIDATAGRQSIGLSGMLAASRPRQFRLQASVLGKSACDIGSNNDEFWYWISQDKPPYLYHCSYKDLATGKVNVPFPLQPDMVVAALGIAEYDAKAKYELREQKNTWELVQATTTASGQPVTRVTVFNKMVARSGQPQVVGHALVDPKGKLICRAIVDQVVEDRDSGSKVPSVVKIQWPAAEMSMKLMLRSIETNKLDAGISARLFSRAGLRLETYDLARGRDTSTSLQQTGLNLRRRGE